MKSKCIRLSSVEPALARASALPSPTLVPASTDPWRSIAPAAKRRASARLVLPAPPGPTSALARVPSDLPGMIVSSGRHAVREKTRPRVFWEASSLHPSSGKFKRGEPVFRRAGPTHGHGTDAALAGSDPGYAGA